MDQLINSPRANQLLDTPRAIGTKLYLAAILLAIVATVLYCNIYMTRSWKLSGIYVDNNDIRNVENVTDEVLHLRQELESLLQYQKQQSNRIRMPTQTRDGNHHTKAKIAIMSSFVPNGNINPPPRLKDEYLKHIINKACYSYIWGYDFIFNTTYGFDDTYPNWHWLSYGTAQSATC